MKAVIIAAGVGSRLGALTKNTPKCLLSVGQQPIIVQQVEALLANNITQITVVVGYFAEKVKKALASYSINFYENPRYRETSMLESLLCAKDQFDDDLLILYGDVCLKPQLLRKVLADERKRCMCVDQNKDVDIEDQEKKETYHGLQKPKGSTKVSLSGEEVTYISKKITKEDCGGEFVGVVKIDKGMALAFKRKIEYLIETGEILHYPSPSYLWNWLIKRGHTLHAVRVPMNSYAEIDYPEDLDKARRLLHQQIKGILFDADGIIYTRTEQTLQPLTGFFREKGHSVSGLEFETVYAKLKPLVFTGEMDKDAVVQKTLAELGIDNLTLEEFLPVFREAYSGIVLHPLIEELFSQLQRLGVKVVVLTDTFASKEQKLDWFRKKGLDTYIDEIVCSSETGFTKFQKESYEGGAKRIGLPVENVAFVGHQAYEMKGAREAGVTSISIEPDIGADFIVQDLLQILELFLS